MQKGPRFKNKPRQVRTGLARNKARTKHMCSPYRGALCTQHVSRRCLPPEFQVDGSVGDAVGVYAYRGWVSHVITHVIA